MKATAVIAEDEPLLAFALRTALAQEWPALEIVASVGDGQAAVDAALALQPDVLFLDVRMPGLDGLDAAAAVADEWPTGNEDRPPPQVVFVTAYDQYAIATFERAAVDYVLKPVRPERLALTCERLQAGLVRQRGERLDAPALDAALDRLRRLLNDAGSAAVAGGNDDDVRIGQPPLRVLQAAVGAAIHLVPVDDVLYFEALDKYVRVVTAAREYWIRTALRELLARLDCERFWQIHRAVVVRAEAIDQVVRDEARRFTATLRGHPARLAVSRLHSPRFKAM